MIERAFVAAMMLSSEELDGLPIFFNFIPENAKSAIMVDTPIPGYEIDPELPGYYNDVTEVVVRHADPERGFEVCQAAMRVLNVINQQYAGYHFNYIRPVTEPTAYPLAKSGLREFAVRFEFSCYRVD